MLVIPVLGSLFFAVKLEFLHCKVCGLGDVLGL